MLISSVRGKAYGVFNIKWLYAGTVLLFEIGSAICGAAPNRTALILGRVIAYAIQLPFQLLPPTFIC